VRDEAAEARASLAQALERDHDVREDEAQARELVGLEPLRALAQEMAVQPHLALVLATATSRRALKRRKEKGEWVI